MKKAIVGVALVGAVIAGLWTVTQRTPNDISAKHLPQVAPAQVDDAIAQLPGTTKDTGRSNTLAPSGEASIESPQAGEKQEPETVVRAAEDTPYGRLAAVTDPTGAPFNLSSIQA